MPCYLFTYHAYGSWLPDRKEGYVRRKRGILPQDLAAGENYRRAMSDQAILFHDAHQRVAVEALLSCVEKTECAAHAIATESSHIHTLVSWSNEQRGWLAIRTSLKRSITLALKAAFDRKRWLSDGASRKQVTDRDHFDYLVQRYLPSHRGWKWDDQHGWFK